MENDFEVKPVSTVPKKKLSQTENLKKMFIQMAMENVRKFTTHLLFGAILIAVGFATYFWYEVSALKKSPQRAAQEETRKLLANVSALIVLPEGETPTIATVSAPEKLKNQPFFAKAQIGDKVLIYTNARKAILYNPESDKIVEVAPLTIGNPTGQKTSPE